MDWITQIEKQKFLIVGSILLVAISALIFTSMRGPVAFDPFWHLQMGKDLLENGLSPWVDHYSFTYNGHEITNPPVLFQAVLHLLTSQFGMVTGFQVLRIGCFLLTISAAFLLLRQIKAPMIVYALIIPVLVFLLQTRAMVRPELFSYTLSIIALMFYFRANNRISTRNLLPMVALMWFWSTYHSSVVGYVIFFGFFLDCAIEQFKSRAPVKAWGIWFAWGVLILAVGFLNPSFSHPLVQAATFPSEWKILISEYLPSGRGLKSIAGIYVLILFAVLTPILALKQRRFGYLVIWAVLVYSAVMMRRMVTPSGIVVVMLTTHLIIESNISHRIHSANSKFWSRFVWLTLLVAISATLYSNVERARHFMREDRAILGRYPVALADYMSRQQVPGRIFNDYGVGGYLIYRLAPHNQVYIDGRTQILYPLEHMQKYEEVRRTKDPGVLRAELDKYSIDKIIWGYRQTRHDLVQDIGGFGLDFLGARYALYTRGTSNFPLLGELLSHPECWRRDMTDELSLEQFKMHAILPEYSSLFPFADLVVGYSKADDGKAFFDATIDGDKWFDEMRRFAGYRFLETGEYDLAVNLLGGVEIRKPKDYLASALAKIKSGDLELASQIIEEYTTIEWPLLNSDEIYFHYKLYQLLESEKKLTLSEQSNAEELKVKLAVLGRPDPDAEPVLDVSAFCTISDN